jgi:hypothetical protein
MEPWPDWRQRDRAALVNRHGDFVGHFEPDKIEKGGIEDDALRIASFGNSFGRDVILCCTVDAWQIKAAAFVRLLSPLQRTEHPRR